MRNGGRALPLRKKKRRGSRTVGIRRPSRAKLSNWGKTKRVDAAPDPALLAQAAATAVYSASPYHCPPFRQRVRPASPCPRRWTDEEATTALRGALSNGHVSDRWENGFPRYVWRRDGNVLYEARHTRGPEGSFHAYPIEDSQAPHGLN